MTETAAQRRRALPTSRWILLAIVLAGVLFSSVYPMRRYFAVRARIETLRQQDVALAERTQTLERERKLLSSDAEVERLAREKMNMVRPGEVPLVIVSPPPPAKAERVGPAGLEPPAEPEQPSLVRRWWEAAVEVARGGL